MVIYIQTNTNKKTTMKLQRKLQALQNRLDRYISKAVKATRQMILDLIFEIAKLERMIEVLAEKTEQGLIREEMSQIKNTKNGLNLGSRTWEDYDGTVRTDSFRIRKATIEERTQRGIQDTGNYVIEHTTEKNGKTSTSLTFSRKKHDIENGTLRYKRQETAIELLGRESSGQFKELSLLTQKTKLQQLAERQYSRKKEKQITRKEREKKKEQIQKQIDSSLSRLNKLHSELEDANRYEYNKLTSIQKRKLTNYKNKRQKEVSQLATFLDSQGINY